MAESGQEFREAGERILRRRTIEEGVKQQKSISEIKAEVQERAPRQTELLTRLMENLINPDPQQLKLTEYFYDILAKDLPDIVACGLSGSGAMGGALVRKESGVQRKTDYDGFIITRPGADDFWLSYQGQRRADQLLDQLLETKNPLVAGMPDNYHFCDHLNYRRLQLIDISQMDGSGAEEYIDQVLRRPMEEAAAIFQYLMPTYPPEIGEKCREKLLSTLSLMSEEKWQKTSKRMKMLWKAKMISVKAKHLHHHSLDEIKSGKRRGASLTRDIRLSLQVEHLAPEVSYRLFEELIDSTRPAGGVK